MALNCMTTPIYHITSVILVKDLEFKPQVISFTSNEVINKIEMQ